MYMFKTNKPKETTTATPAPQETKVINVKRLKNSLQGNPKYEFNFNDVGLLTTPANASWVYSFSTDTFFKKSVSIKYHITRTGQIYIR
jgi:hypothetical protein